MLELSAEYGPTDISHAYPEKQGLKHPDQVEAEQSQQISHAYPEKQGLKPGAESWCL